MRKHFCAINKGEKRLKKTINSIKDIEKPNKIQEEVSKVDTHSEKFTLMEANYPKDDRYEDITFPNKEYKVSLERPTRIYCDGIFDMFHYGHARLFEQVKNLFPNVHLVIGVTNDELTIKNKGKMVMNEKERAESVSHCKYVDEIIENVPWTTTFDFLESHNIDYVAHDDIPYPSSTSDDVYGHLKKAGKFIPTKRAKNISTTAMITRIIKDYHQYVKRQILRGISHKDLNISIFEEVQIKIQQSLGEDVEYMKEELRIALNYWEDVTKKLFRKIKSKFTNDSSFMGKFIRMIKSIEKTRG